jgi:hypothetical protein
MASVSRYVRNQCLGVGAFKTVMEGCELRLYKTATPPVSPGGGRPAAEAALTAEDLLITFKAYESDGTTLDEDGMKWGTPDHHVIPKDPDQIWKGTATAAGVATFYVYMMPDDTGAEDTDGSKLRIMGLVAAAGGDMTANATFAIDDERTIGSAYHVFTSDY